MMKALQVCEKLLLKTILVLVIGGVCADLATAQTGPGGVGNAGGINSQPKNTLWLDAASLSQTDGTDVNSWPDRSGNTNDFGGSSASSSGYPAFRTSPFNYLEFVDTEHDRLVKNTFSGFPASNITTFIIYNTTTTGSGEGVISYAVSGESNEYLWINNDNFSIYLDGSSKNPGTKFNDGSWNVAMNSWRNSDGLITLYKNGTEEAISGNTNFKTGVNLVSGGTLAIGGEQDAIDGGYQTNQDLNGNIAEVVVYDAYLNDAQRIIVENYFNSKYNIAIANDYYNGDQGANGDYDFDVAGIGYEGGTQHVEANSSGFILSTYNTSLNTNGEFLITGHDNTTNATVTTNLQAGIEERFAKTWYVDKTGSFDATLTFDINQAYAGGQYPYKKENYVLLRYNSGSTQYEEVNIDNTDKEVSGSKITFRVADAELSDGVYTLGTKNATESPVAGSPNRTWYSYQSGLWSDHEVWTLDGSASPLLVNPDSETPASADLVVITSGRTVTSDINNITIGGIEVIGTIDIANTSGHNFNTIIGNGRIRMAGSGGIDNFPSGEASGFVDVTDGGTLEIYGPTDIEFNQQRSFNDVLIDMSTGSDQLTLLNDFTVNGDLRLKVGTLRINDNTTTNSVNITVYGDYTIDPGAQQTVGTANARHEFNFFGDFTNNGIAYFSQRTSQVANSEATNGIVDANFLADNQDQRVDANNSTYFYRIVCDKGFDPTYILDLQTSNSSRFVLTGPVDYNVDLDVDEDSDNNNALALINGTTKIGTNVIINPLNNTGNYSIGSNARLWVDGGTVTKTGGAAIVPYGIVEVSGGRLIVTSNSGITTRGTGQFKCSDGTVAIPQLRTSVLGDSQIGGFEQSGGEVRVGVFTPNSDFPGLGLPTNSSSPNSNYYTFSLTYGGNSFIMSGGTLKVKDATNKGLIFINSDPINVSVSGGTIIAESSNTNLAKLTSRAHFYDLVINNSINSTNANARVAVTTGNSGVGGDARTIIDPDLRVLNNLTLQTGTTRTESNGTYGAYLDLCNGGNCNDLAIGRDLTINDNTVLDIWSGETANANSSTVVFNGSVNATLYFGDITTYKRNLVGYVDPENNQAFERWEHPFYNLIIDKPGDTLFLEAKNPIDENSSNFKAANGGKNVNSWRNNIFLVTNEFTLTEGTVLNQVDQNTAGVGYSIRLYGSAITNNGTCFIYEDGVTPKNAQVKFRVGGGDITLNTIDGSEFGNIRVNSGSDIVYLTSDVYIKRLEYRHGTINIESHNLKVDVFDINLANGQTRSGGGNRIFSTEDMIVMSGNASDGGLSLKLDKNTNTNFPQFEGNRVIEYNSDDWLWFPIGTNANASSRYTPAVCYINTVGTYDGDEYITVRVVDRELQTTDLSGGDILSYYWNVDFEGMASGEEPDVSWLFQYAEADVVGTEANYVPGKVLNGGSYSRSDDGSSLAIKEAGDAGNDGDILGNNPRNIIIFNGIGSNAIPDANDDIDTNTNDNIFQNGPNVDNQWRNAYSNPVGFTLEKANYTAGEPNRFVGAPEVFYSRRVSSNYNITGMPQWSNGNTWSKISHTGAAAGDWPQDGDVAIVGFGGSGGGSGGNRHHVAYRNTDNYNLASVVIDASETAGVWDSRLFIQEGSTIDMGVVDGDGTVEVRLDISSPSTINGDFGLFSNNGDEGARFLFHCENGSVIEIPQITDVFPNVRIEGGGNREVYFPTAVTINNELRVDSEATIRPRFDLHVLGDFRLGNYREGKLLFPDDTEITVKVDGRLRLSSDNQSAVNVENDNSNPALVHRLIIKGNIELSQGNRFDLFNGTGANDDNCILEIKGEENTSIFNSDNMPVELYQLVINKGNSATPTFTIEDNSGSNAPNFGASATATHLPLEVLNGTLIIDDPQVNWNIANGTSFRLPNTTNLEASSGSGAIDLRQGVLSVEGNNTGILLDGLLHVNGGELDMDDNVSNGNNFIEYSSSGNAVLQVSSGLVNVGSHIRRTTTNATGVLKYRQSGGTVQIGTQSAPLNDRGLFEVVNSGSEFTHTGGDFIIHRQNGTTASVATLLLAPSNYNLAGSIINLGGTETPASQTITINSEIPLNQLVVNTNNSPVAQIVGRTLTINSELNINTGATFDANAWDLTINGDLVTDGIYTANGNNTIFSGSSAQQLGGAVSPTFYDFTKQSSSTLSLNSTDITVENDLYLYEGILNDGGQTITLLGNMVHDAVHATPNATGGEGIVFAGVSRQELSRTTNGNSSFGKVTINNPNDVIVPNGNGYNFTINNALRLSTGIFDIGGSLLTITADANIVEINSFGVNNMIQTNSSFTDNGVKRFFNAISTPTDLIFPLGQTKYTPVVFSISNSDAGSFTVRPANERHPTIIDDTESPEIDDLQNVLQYHWIIKAEDVTNFSGEANMTYAQADVSVTGSNAESDYIPARIYANDTFWDKSLSPTDVNTSTNVITFPFSNIDAGNITGDYTAGIPNAIPDQVPTYESTGSGGDYTASGTWTPVGSAPSITEGVGPIGAVIIVKNGDVVNLDQNDIRIYRTVIESGATLEINGTINHGLGAVTGTGTLRVVSNTSSAVLPAGYYTEFFDCSGGGLEYAGSGNYDILGGISSLRSLTLSGSGSRTLPSNNVTICDDLIVDGPLLANANNKVITVQNDFILTNGSYENDNGELNIDNNLNINSGSFDGGIGNQNVVGNVNLTNGTLNVGTGGMMTVQGNFTYSGGTFDGGSGNAKVTLMGSSQQTLTGSFTGVNRFHRLEVNNAGGMSLSGSIDIADELLLTNGIIRTNGGSFLLEQDATVSPVGGKNSSYVNGRVHKVILNNSDFVFPTGNGSRYGRLSITNVNSSPAANHTWYAQYYNQGAVEAGATSTYDAADTDATKTVSRGEHWIIGDDAPGTSTVTANIGLRWDNNSDVSPDTEDHSELNVIAWNPTNSNWDNYGGTGHNPSTKTFQSSSLLSFSEKVVTLGSGSPANPLPVELIDFIVKLKNNKALLQWKTASEKNNDYFEVQRSEDGQSWANLGKIEGAGDSHEELDYKFTDENPLYGVSYYRLRQVDYDGQYDFSNIIVLENFKNNVVQSEPELHLYPNPAQLEELVIRALNLDPLQQVEVSLSDIYGKQYLKEVVEGNILEQGVQFKTSVRLSSGLYLVSVKQNNTLLQKKVIIKK